MNITIQIGWWLLPLLATLGAVAWAWWYCESEEISHGGYFGGFHYYPFVAVPVAIIITLSAWLIWSLLT